MAFVRDLHIDNTLPLVLEGYGWLPNRRRRAGGDAVHTRLLGQRAVGLGGPEAARFFYDEEHVRPPATAARARPPPSRCCGRWRCSSRGWTTTYRSRT